ncbi:MAG: DJ-1/PfpI family protein [Lachnospiraceae bacterium]|nr:DJ-1/PfpI family protein [Lachnospiraceae bacterium]
MAKLMMTLSNGCEEIEALTVVDMLRRSGVEVVTVAVEDEVRKSRGCETSEDEITDYLICGSHNIEFFADEVDYNIEEFDFDCIVLPGGLPGTNYLRESSFVKRALDYAVANDKYICAICAAPSVLSFYGITDGKKVTAYPGFENSQGMEKAEFVPKSVIRDGKIITASGMGLAIPFSAEIIKVLVNEKKAEDILQGIIYK